MNFKNKHVRQTRHSILEATIFYEITLYSLTSIQIIKKSISQERCLGKIRQNVQKYLQNEFP